MDRRTFIKLVMMLDTATLSAAKASDFQFPLPIVTDTTLPGTCFSSASEDDLDGCVIKIMGIGGAGCNAIEHSMLESIRRVDFIVADTDTYALNRSSAPSKIQFGETSRGGWPNPEAGCAAAEVHRDDIRTSLEGTHMLFITAGMGGSMGTGATPVVAEIAREMGIHTIGVVTKPFSFEGSERMKIAEAGIAELEKQVDSLIVISNDKLSDLVGDNAVVDDCFKAADDVLKNAIGDIANIITFQGLVGVDFEDVRTVTGEMGLAKLGSASSTGIDRARISSEKAVASPLLEGIINLSGAKGVVVIITAAKGNLKMKEINEVMNTVKTNIADDAHIIFGTVYDEQMADAMRVTLVAAGINKVTEAPLVACRKYPTVEELANSGVDRYDIPAFLRNKRRRLFHVRAF